MKYGNKFLAVIGILFFILYRPGYTQGGDYGGHFNPDSLTLVTVSGTAIVDSSMMNTMYFLDEDGDSQADYLLNFGPYWYQPDSSAASRPGNGDNITITGGQYDSTMFGYPGIVVYEINGDFWRDPYNPFWTTMGGHMHGGGHHQGNCTGFAFGWMHDSLQTVSVNGTALVDSTFIMARYYLDEDNDGSSEYLLNFGPPWYEPASGATRPDDGEQISIRGGLIPDSTLSMIVVYEINGLVWRDSSQVGSQFGGTWMNQNMSDSVRIHAPFDPDDWMQVNPGWHQMGGGHHGGMMPDSLFGRMLQLFPHNIPNGTGQNIFAGYEIGMFDSSGQNMMWQGGQCGGHMNFGSAANFQLHYNDIQLQGFNIDESTVEARYWDDQSAAWVTVSNAVLDPVNNRVVFSETEVSNFMILTGEKITGIEENKGGSPVQGFTLKQNYPNPFNPSTMIQFTLKSNAEVVLNVYNVLGQQIANVLNETMEAGTHQVEFRGEKLPSGIYFYELKANGESIVKRMNLVR